MIEFALAEAVRNRVAGSAAGDLRARLIGAVTQASSLAGEAIVASRAPAGCEPIDCGSGCSYCCHMRVVATVPEVIALHDHIAARFQAGQRLEFTDRLRRAAHRTSGMTDEEWGRARVPCPLLVEGACSAYQARPLDCRGYNSTRVAACAAAFADYDEWDVPMDEPMMAMNKSAQAGLLQGLAGLGRRPCLVELTAALAIAFDQPSAIDRWLAGEDSFAAAELDPSDPEQRAFLPWVPSDILRTAAEDEASEP